ncbi:multidrug resistance protein MdtG [Clostridium pasteurianum DSM 525 = ATCC 6013]|uniref:Major facilitator superfamily MFS_1 n=1 Tax=Clostridium pasteurianum DSM 525 = ATCC 6013 TaxID=1262449 RepID=A0A0H3J6Q9_CLOPA|nr:multidrug efflux MFS transporter [Clostridium pasteurianum]AJA46650.1 multidrug resistance protein MdtG [Clostridium pasteurianum DSM 525 = ATCC 6013]AJA50638.1 multidrug resistance protein MdtG [Clostridium pasteurianum DSM 525 = ATCC 6013]AOZ74060.1 MFS transporter [Clostridium pasteurianum DSM 525 = ATCC 6013]AOZ77857.1 MFS transporter [Clostridium pasteurianum]ELP61215.1 permease [Clostridium pasteurianum DSM 525 = ATCC 6013]
MKIWKRNLIVCWFGTFVTLIGMSQIAPIMPLYIKQLGIHNVSAISQISGIAFGATFVVSAIFSPIWGYVADRFGRKPMLLRASLGMAVVVGSMGLAQNVYQLIGLRILQGVITGYSTACTTLVATQTEKKHAGWALGVLSTAFVSGSLLGPLVGGYLDEFLGLKFTFFLTGGLMLIAFFTTLFFVKEDFVPSEKKKVESAKELWKQLPNSNIIVTLFVSSFILQFAYYSVEPIITIYIGQLAGSLNHVALIAGMAFSASGLANIIAAPRLGKLSDRIGPQKVVLGALILAGIVFIPQAFVKNPWQLMALRFGLGIATAGLSPSINTLLKKITPEKFTGRIFGFNISAYYMGTFTGSVIGGQIAAHLGIKYVFFITSSLLFFNAIWVYRGVYKKLKDHDKISEADIAMDVDTDRKSAHRTA